MARQLINTSAVGSYKIYGDKELNNLMYSSQGNINSREISVDDAHGQYTIVGDDEDAQTIGSGPSGIRIHVVENILVKYGTQSNSLDEEIMMQVDQDQIIYADSGIRFIQGFKSPYTYPYTPKFTVEILKNTIIDLNVFHTGGGTSQSGVSVHVAEDLLVKHGTQPDSLDEDITMQANQEQIIYANPSVIFIQGFKMFQEYQPHTPLFTVEILKNKIINLNVFHEGGGIYMTFVENMNGKTVSKTRRLQTVKLF